MFANEKYKIVPVLNTADYNAGVSADSINMAKAHRAIFILTFGAITGDAVLTVNSGATAAALTSALTFKYAIGGAAIGTTLSDVLAAGTEAATLTLVAATYANKMLVIEINADAMDTANNENWLTLALSAAADAGVCHAVALVEPRYSDNTTLV